MTYDVAILGAGPGGYAAALRAALRGARVCLVEADQLGGTCLNVGCIPTKAMLHASGLAWEARSARTMGLSVGDVSVDPAAFARRVAQTVTTIRKGVEKLLEARNVVVVRGRGRLVAPDCIKVTPWHGRLARGQGPSHGRDARATECIEAKSIIIATGSRPARPGFAPWDSPRVMTTDQAAIGELPGSILIVGGGVIGCEFATVYSELGITTHLVEAMDDLLPGVDADAAKIVARGLKRRKVKIATGAGVASMTANDDSVTAEVTDGGTITAATALIAAGRQANIEDIGLEDVGVAVDGGIIPVDDHCRTNVSGIYAIGDVAENRQYAHLASRMGVIAADNAVGHDAADDRRVVPECFYTHPEVAVVGLRNLPAGATAATFPLQASGLARAYGQTDGLTRLYGDAEGRLVGALAIGPRATDMIAEATLAIRHALTVADVAETIHAHPTFAESAAEAAQAWLGLPIHTLE